MKYSANTVQLESTYVSQSEEQISQIYDSFGKRCFDVVVSSLVMLTVLAWLVPVLGILIKLSSPGPVFFVQWRTGRNGKKFRCLKFRTMRQNAVAPFKQATQNDPRITQIGKFLRKTNLDEMPQFINVLRGEMSVVGPRPHAVEHDAQYWNVVPNFNKRYTIKPGITGLAQTRGLRGEAGLKDMEHRLKLDRWYIQNQSPILDVKICWWTVSKMLKGDEKAY
ncbi:MAG: sugar transferase [Siphonobacter sp.]